MTRFTTHAVEDLCPHPCFVRHLVPPSLDKISAIAAKGEDAFRDPLTITRKGVILDGYARRHLAKTQDRPTLDCLELTLSEDEATQYVIRNSRRTAGLNDYLRIVLALDLEEVFKAKAYSKQQQGARVKVSSNLTEAPPMDARTEIAKLAGVAAGNVTKVKHLSNKADPDIIAALRTTEIRIHKAWLWSKLPAEDQRTALCQFRRAKGMKLDIRRLLAAHPKKFASASSLRLLRSGLKGLEGDPRLSVR
jgi:hypothetical protein